MSSLSSISSMVMPFFACRELNATPAQVFQAWVEPEKLAEWFGPKGATVEVRKLDATVGGLCHYALNLADGSRLLGRWEFEEIASPKRLVLTNAFADEAGEIVRLAQNPDWPRLMRSIVRFDDFGGRTLLTLEWTPHQASMDEIDAFEKARAMLEIGWGDSLDRLERYLASSQESGADAPAAA